MTGEHLHHNNGNPDVRHQTWQQSACMHIFRQKSIVHVASVFDLSDSLFCKDVREAEDWMPRDFQLKKKIDNQPFDILKASWKKERCDGKVSKLVNVPQILARLSMEG